MKKERIILHCDCNGFYASVECCLRPELWRVPMAVAGNPKSRHGIILAKNELAKQKGVQTAETIWQAKSKCPDLVLVPPQHDVYREFSRRINAIYDEYTDLVEPFSIDESFLDVTGSLHLFAKSPQELADLLRRRVREEIGLTISVGVSFCKLFAKMGSDYKKPDATTVITQENYRQLLYPLPVSALLFVGKSAAEKLSKLGIRTIGDLAARDRESIAGVLGKNGGQLWDQARGLDDSRVIPVRESGIAKSIGRGMTFKRNLLGAEEVRVGIEHLADDVAARLRAHGLKCRTVQLSIKSPSLKVIQRQKPLSAPSFLFREIADAAMELFCASWEQSAPVRALTVTAQNLVSQEQAIEQLDLLGEQSKKREKLGKLEQAVYALRQRFGEASIGPAATFEHELFAKEDEEAEE
ncbi:DNA polymerase IV [Christensenellaceae bacterium 44-20]